MPEPTRLAQLNDELEDLDRRYHELRDAHPGAVMPEDARNESRQIVARTKDVKAAITVEQQKLDDAEMNALGRFMDEPARKIIHPVNADDAGRRELLDAGWKFKGTYIARDTSIGEINMIPQEMLFGPMPGDAELAHEYQRARSIFQPEYGQAFRKMLRAKGHMGALTSQEQNALSEGVSEGGGYTVPPDAQAEILARRARMSVMRSLCTVRQTTRDRITFPAVAANSSSGSVYSSAFVGGLVGETPTSNTDNGPTWEQFEIGIKDFETYTRVSNNLIMDSMADVMAFLARDGGRNLALVEDNYFLTGDGTGLEPLGLLNIGSDTVDVEGATSDTVDNSTTATGSAGKLITLAYTLPPQYAENATWLSSHATKGLVHALVDADNRPWWQAAAGAGGEAGAPPQLLGSPYRTSAFMPEDGTNANKVFIFGDFSEYYIADRLGISVIVDDVNRIAANQTDIYIRSRAGGGAWNTDAFRYGIV